MLRLSVLMLLALAACRVEEESLIDEGFLISSDFDSLAERLTILNKDIPLVEPAAVRMTGVVPGVESFTAVQVAELIPPTVSGTTLQTSDVLIDSVTAFVGYHVAGEAGFGGIDVLDISRVLAMQLVSSVSSNTSEFRSLAREGADLYSTGSSTNGGGGAFLKKISLDGSQLTNTIATTEISGSDGLDVLLTGSSVAVVSGHSGGLGLFNKSTMALEHMVAIDDSRALGLLDDGSFMVLSGQPGQASVISSSGVTTQTLNLGGLSIAGAGSSLQVGPKWSLAALGDGGMTVFCNADGTVIANITPVSASGTSQADTAAAASDFGLIFSANEAAGVYVYTLKDVTTSGGCGTGSLTLLGVLDFADSTTVKSVFYKNGLLFVVTGSGTLKVLSIMYSSVVPLSRNL